jgi:DNA polymerase III subunit chi
VTDISFHFNVPDPMAYACRLLRKAVRRGARVVVSAPDPVLSQLDRQLWTFEPLDFIAHIRLAQGHAIEPRLQATPVWLLDSLADAQNHDVLLNLHPEVIPGFEKFSRLIEIVSLDEAERTNARIRWKHYTQAKHPITRHDVGEEIAAP